jgi:hypothetical protein
LSSVVVTVLILQVVYHYGLFVSFSFFYFISWMCAPLISLSRLLLQMLDVIGIFVILIYILLGKKEAAT